MTEKWKQFSLYPPGCRNKLAPLQVLHGFLPEFIANNLSITRWHCLFEPSALVRLQSDEFSEVERSAAQLVLKYGLELHWEDCSRDLNPDLQFKGEDYGGEAGFYGETLWAANAKFMQACSELSLEIAKLDHQKQTWMMRKFNHLFWNALGLNYLEEAGMSRVLGDRATELYKEHGRA